jgi:hypothetical protein
MVVRDKGVVMDLLKDKNITLAVGEKIGHENYFTACLSLVYNDWIYFFV